MTATHIVPGMSFTDEQLDMRRQTLGASEVPAVLGLDRYRSPLDIWLLKKGAVAPFAGSPETEWGLRMEPAIRQKVAETLGLEIALGNTVLHPTASFLSATPDGLLEIEQEPAVLEIKNKGERQSVYWGDPGTDSIPNEIAAQCYVQMMCTGRARAVVAVLFGKADFRLYHLRRDDEIATSILNRCAEFWQRHVVDGIEPDITGGKPTAEYLKRKFATHSEALRSATREEEGLIAQLRTIREKAKALDDQESGIVNKLMNAIGADAGIQGRSGRITWKAPRPSIKTDYKALVQSLDLPSSKVLEFTTEVANSRRFLASFPREG